MRRIATVLICIVAFALAASPALAQKDPFDPLITEESTSTAPTDTTAPAHTTGTTTTVDPVPADEPMPSTGADPSSWIGLALLAMALGAGLLVLGRVLDPAN